jgi:hypothetical protein
VKIFLLVARWMTLILNPAVNSVENPTFPVEMTKDCVHGVLTLTILKVALIPLTES